MAADSTLIGKRCRVSGEDLRRLDEELAAGRLSSDDYRRQRDELIASGSPIETGSAGEPAAPARDGEPPAEQPTEVHQVGEQPTEVHQANPFPPAFRWETAPPTETTQVIKPVQAEEADPAASTQVVRSQGQSAQGPAAPELPGQPQQGASDGDSERTQVVPSGVPTPPPGYNPNQQPPAPGPPPGQGPGPGGLQQNRPNMPQQVFPPHPQQQGGPGSGGFPAQGRPNQPGPWGGGFQDSTPPWAASDLPPPQAGSSWSMQGLESFEGERKKPRAGRIVAVVLVVVVLLGIGVGAFFLFSPGDSPDPGPDTTTQAQPPAEPTEETTTTPEEPPGPPIADLPGQPEETGPVRDFAGVEALGYLTDGELDALRSAGPGECAFQLSNDAGNRAIVLVTELEDPATARDQLADLQLEFQLNEIPEVPAGVRGAGNDMVSSGPPVLRRAHYVSGDYLVRVQASGEDVADIDGLFFDVLAAQLDELPVDG